MGRITTVDHRPGEEVPEAEGRYVYKQERCRRCGTSSEAGERSGRTTYRCPRCQPG